MKKLLIAFLAFTWHITGNCQLPIHDSSSLLRSVPDTIDKPLLMPLSIYKTTPEWIIMSYENISLVATGGQTLTERTILELESMECDALKEHNLAALQRLWLRDFTIDQRQNKVLISNDPLPRYAALSRLVKAITELDTAMVCTSGIETYQEINRNLDVSPNQERTFFHTWIKRNGIWKLSTKRHEEKN